jgi:hypothetical protein
MSEVIDKPKTDEKAAAAAAPKKRFVVVDPQRMQGAEYLRNEWICTAEEGTLVEDVLDPGYWAHIAGKLTVYDRIEVRVDTGEWLLELLVKSLGRNWAQVALLHHHDLAGKVITAEAPSDEFEAVYKGTLRKWCVMRKSDNAVLHEKAESKAGALEWLAGYERTVLQR